MDYFDSFSAFKQGNAYVVYVYGLHPDRITMPFQVDAGSAYTLLGLNSFYHPKKSMEYDLLKKIIAEEIEGGGYESVKHSGITVTQEKVELYPCRYQGVSVSSTNPGTFYIYIYLGDVDTPLLGFDYLDDCSFHHGIGGNLIVNAIAENVGKRFYPEKLLDFNIILEKFRKERKMDQEFFR